MRVYISPSSQWGNIYAYGDTNEAEQCQRIANKLGQILTNNGFTVKVGSNESTITQRVNESNEFLADIHIPIHTNAGGGSGALVITHPNNTSNKFVVSVYNELCSLVDNADDGIVGRTDLAEITDVNALTVYTEAEFHDNVNGAKFIIENYDKIAQAIANGIISANGGTPDGGDGDTDEPPTVVPTPKPVFSEITVSREKLALYSQEQVNNAYHIWAHLVGLNQAQSSLRFYWDELSSAAVLGNMVVESSINPGVFEGFIDGDINPYAFEGGYGLVQWTPASKFWTWAGGTAWLSSALSIMHKQLERILYEYENPTVQWNASKGYRLSFEEFALNKRNLSLDELTYSWGAQYEQPADLSASLKLRQQYAEYYYKLFTGLTPPKRKMHWIYYLKSPAIKYL